MRVAHLLRKYDPSQWGGTETAIRHLTAGLASQGVDSIVYSPRLAHPAGAPDPLEAAGCVQRRFDAWVPVWGISRERREKMTAVGGNLVSFGLLGALRREPGLDLVHSHALGRLGAIGRAAARGRRLPFVLSVHGGAYDLPGAILREMRESGGRGLDWGKIFGLAFRARRLFSEADAVVVVNPREAELIRARHPGRRIVVQPHGVAASAFAADHRSAAWEAFPMLRDRPILLVPGRIDPVKNQGWVIDRAAALARRHPRVVIVFAGACTDSSYGSDLQSRIAGGGLGSAVHFTGQLPPGDPRLIGLFQAASAVVLAGASETFGLVILEAWAAGTPVISSRTSGAASLIEDGRNGFLYDLDRPADFLAAADLMLRHPEARDRCARNGRAKAVAEYDTGILAARMARLYGELIEAAHALRNPAR